MKYKIKHKIDGRILFSLKTTSMKLCVKAAVKSGADLAGANLADANLAGANLAGADLACADLAGADLAGANLAGANLAGAYLAGADLAGVYLADADLAGAYLRGANLGDAYLGDANLGDANLAGAYLRGANLRGANLVDADLAGADLAGADLAGAKGINYNLCTPLAILLEQTGKIRAYKLVTAELTGPYYPTTTYEHGKTVTADVTCDDVHQQCAPGISVATLDWCMRNWKEGYRILIVEFDRADLVCIPIATDGKFRVRECTVVGEKDLKEIGLIK